MLNIILVNFFAQIGNGNLPFVLISSGFHPVFVSEWIHHDSTHHFSLARAWHQGCHRRSAAYVPSVPPYKDPNEGRRVISPGSRWTDIKLFCFVWQKLQKERYVCGFSVWFPVSVFRPLNHDQSGLKVPFDAQQTKNLGSCESVCLEMPRIWWWYAMCDGTSIARLLNMMIWFWCYCCSMLNVDVQNLYRSSSCDAAPVPPANRDTGAPRLFSIDIPFSNGWLINRGPTTVFSQPIGM